MHVERIAINVVTDAGGAATVYSDVIPYGMILGIAYTKDANTPFADGSTMTLTCETTGMPIWAETGVNASAQRMPTQPTHKQDGTPILYAGAGQPVQRPIVLANERLKLVVAGGGNTKSGKLEILIG